ncbi:MAG: TlpA disulfide reductase family protein [Phenylobacterium sp.]|uniref:TlpA family protein disulfide reductase n=1 Tax=Phenylobacterium sp. TaxID=1871053 RepID=UPI002736C1D6|nr:TlpA disulfide reductase family protein [Phenylobacterium sp.]MDP1642426.1 TlpA disulfide reductase family protein [Phenylobacterium sp.]MDP3117173.1 TlpA disulfide reductase family protein [Phenylobacterium sp.]
MSDQSTAKPGPRLFGKVLWGVAALGVAAVVYIIGQASTNPDASRGMRAFAKGEMAALQTPKDPRPAPVTTIYDPDGQPVRLGDYRGEVVVLNLWATWCPPCVAEMPTLAALAKHYEGQPVRVLAVSIDRPTEIDKARTFIGQHAPLAFYSDPNMKLAFDLVPPAPGMPTTVIYGADGIERARLSGGADWGGEDAKAVVDQVLGAE